MPESCLKIWWFLPGEATLKDMCLVGDMCLGTLIKTYCVLVLYIAITIHRELYVFESDNWFVLSQRCLLFWKEKRKKKKDRMVLITSINARQIRLPVARRPEICAGARQPTLITTRPGNMIEVQGYSQIRYRHITGSVQSRQLFSRAASKHALIALLPCLAIAPALLQSSTIRWIFLSIFY